MRPRRYAPASPRPCGPLSPPCSIGAFAIPATSHLLRPEQRPDISEWLFSSSGRLSRLPFLAGEAAVLSGLWLYDRWITGWPRLLTGWAALFVLLFAGCCLVARRLHDLGRAGWWTALYLVAFIWAWSHPASWVAAMFGVLVLELCLRPGQVRANRFGPGLKA